MVEIYKNFVAQVELIDVFLKSQTAQSFVLPRTIDPEKVNLDFDFKARFERIEGNILISYISLFVSAKKIKDEKSKDFEINSEYALVYNLAKYKGEITDELLLNFSKRTALFSAYPYLRECIHSLSCKLGVPPVITPLLKLNLPKSEQAEEVTKKVTKKVRVKIKK